MATVGAQEEGRPAPEVRALPELRSSGLLWLINRVVFHPRGYALALEVNEDGDVEGWSLAGGGTEPYEFAPDVDEAQLLAAANFTLGLRPT